MPPCRPAPTFADEGAANHMRLCRMAGVGAFCVLARAGRPNLPPPLRYAARHTREASAAIARLHQLDPDRIRCFNRIPPPSMRGCFITTWRPSPMRTCCCAISARGRGSAARPDPRPLYSAHRFGAIILGHGSEVPLADAVRSYCSTASSSRCLPAACALIAPTHCLDVPAVQRFIEQMIAGDNPIMAVHYTQVRQSMRNGGGPACLRLRHGGERRSGPGRFIGACC